MNSNNNLKDVKLPTAAQSLVAGSLSGMAGILVCHPLDVIRTNIQISNKMDWSKFRSLTSLYRGFWAPFAAQTVYKSIIFTTNSWSMRYLFQEQRTVYSIWGSGCISGAVNTCVVAPIEFIRTQLILSSSKGHTSGKAAASSSDLQQVLALLQSSHGRRGLFSALIPTICRDGPGMAFYMLTYDRCKVLIADQMTASSSSPSPSSSASPSITAPPSLSVRLIAGSLAGIAFWIWALPIDTIKAMIEASYQHHQQNASTAGQSTTSIISSREVLHRMIRAMPYAFLRGIPSAAVTLTTYDLCLDYFLS